LDVDRYTKQSSILMELYKSIRQDWLLKATHNNQKSTTMRHF